MGFHWFYKFSLLITLWFHVDGALGITCHVLEQENQVLLVGSPQLTSVCFEVLLLSPLFLI